MIDLDITETKLVPLKELKPSKWNPRKISEEDFRNLCASIQAAPDLMTMRPIIARPLGDGMNEIIGGNMRYRACERIKWTVIPAIIREMTDDEAREIAIRDNNNWGSWDDDALSEILWSLQESEREIGTLGFDQSEIDRLLGEVGTPGTDELDDGGESTDEGGQQVGPAQYTFDELQPTGILFKINEAIFHPLGYEFALHFDASGSRALGFSINGDGEEPMEFDEKAADVGQARFNTLLTSISLLQTGKSDLSALLEDDDSE